MSLAQDVVGALAAASAVPGRTPAQIAAEVGVEGTQHTSPAYPGNSADSHDIAVITFNQNQSARLDSRWSFTPTKLPARNQLAKLGARALDASQWLTVGYGTEEAQRGPGGHTHPGGGVRRKALVGFNALNPTWVRLAMNESRGFGGACYGDSGGPNFLTVDGKRMLAATTVTGDSPCYATNVVYRMDTDTARTFLGQYVTLP
ncbi:hypothetical protein AB0M36_23635 [Actinoplanes sp. NPDC051346]|uniref:hypothetical protein n=1 Tax=Actinoplanes sp. NPDC051346 TaxID=3155048 RepID=UPI00342DAD0E